MRWSVQGAWASAEVLGLSWALGLALFTSGFFALYLSSVASRDAVAPAVAGRRLPEVGTPLSAPR
jgi:hypothetical protein